jgi:hypothetical protein
MCRNIRLLYNFDPPAGEDEIKNASLQFVRKVSGYNKPSLANESVFNKAVEDIAEATQRLLQGLVTNGPKRDREVEHQKAHQRSLKRFGAA